MIRKSGSGKWRAANPARVSRAARIGSCASRSATMGNDWHPPAPNTPSPPTNVVWSLAFSPDGKQLAVGGADAQIHLFNVADGKLIRSIPGHTGAVTGLTFHPSGTVLASCSKDRTVRL